MQGWGAGNAERVAEIQGLRFSLYEENVSVHDIRLVPPPSLHYKRGELRTRYIDTYTIYT